uniref:Uncharacterized protein n=1 Tax=Heterorhabditis bacteriophora TaxID=37862 RepID=A0A1I7WL58_HETBA
MSYVIYSFSPTRDASPISSDSSSSPVQLPRRNDERRSPNQQNNKVKKVFYISHILLRFNLKFIILSLISDLIHQVVMMVELERNDVKGHHPAHPIHQDQLNVENLISLKVWNRYYFFLANVNDNINT